MKKLRKNLRLVTVFLIALFVLLAGYGAYSVAVYGNRWFSSSANTFARTQKKNVIPGDIQDRNGIVLATAADGKRVYLGDAAARMATVHAVGDSGSNVNNSAENDLVIYDLGHEQMVIEALVSESIDWNNAWEHLYKLIGDGRNRPIMLLIYGHSKQSVRDREAMMQLVRKEMQEPQIKEVRFTELRPLSDVENLYIPGLFGELPKELVEYCMVTEVSHPGYDNFPLFVLYADITRRANVEISKQAREGKPSPNTTVV